MNTVSSYRLGIVEHRPKQTDHRRLKRFRRFAAVLLIGHFLIAPIMKIDGWPRTYPIDSWSLFSKVPNTITDYSIRIVELNGVALSHPIWFEQGTSKHSHSHSARSVTLLMGEALSKGDEREADRLRNVFQSNFVSDLPGARFELVRRRYEVLERFKTDQFDDLTVLLIFNSDSSFQIGANDDQDESSDQSEEGILSETGGSR